MGSDRIYKPFFKYAIERHKIFLKQRSLTPRPWTKDQILQTYRFTNVFRELDKTTAWFSEHVRMPLKNKPEVLLATVVFRMFNRIEIGETIFCQTDLLSNGKTAFESFCEDYNVKHLRRAIKSAFPKGPYVTGAYIISTPPGLNKLDGVLNIIEQFCNFDWEQDAWAVTSWEEIAKYMRREQWSLQKVFDELRKVPYLGTFHSYEIVTDLRHTKLLEKADDVNLWANVGPGAARGLNRIHGRGISARGKLTEKVSTEQMLYEMQEILRRVNDFWPNDWPRWELREVEHTLCEFDKYERVRLGHGRPRGVYR